MNLSMYLYDETYPSTYSAIQKFRVGKIFVLFLNVFESLLCQKCSKNSNIVKYCYNLK